MNAIDLMTLEHDAIKSGLSCLETLAHRAARTGGLERALVEGVLSFFRGFSDEIHHGKEENVLFPWLVSKGLGEEGGLVADLTHEHDELRTLVAKMRASIRALDAEAVVHFSEEARAYVSLLRSHVRREDDHLFGAASLVATLAEQAQLKAACEELDRPRLEARRHLLEELASVCRALGLAPFVWPQDTSAPTPAPEVRTQRPHRVAIVGAGPAGFYTAAALLNQTGIEVEVDLLDRLPTPYGLVRAGIAPDHGNAKAIVKLFERWVSRPGFGFFGNVELGRDVSVDELLSSHDQVVYATGSEADRRLGIPGEGLPGTTPASVFVGWYNAHPDYRDVAVDLGCRRVAIVGNGNVALDIARILARDVAELEPTEIADHALMALSHSKIEDIFILGRRGITEASFGPKELQELCSLKNVDIVVRKEELDASALEAGTAAGQRNLQLLRAVAERPHHVGHRRIHLRFFVTPTAILPHVDRAHLHGVELAVQWPAPATGDGHAGQSAQGAELLSVDWLYSAIGYRGRPLPGVPFDETHGVIANVDGRVIRDVEHGRPGREYCVGWARTGARGVIGTHKLGAESVVQVMLADAKALIPAPAIERGGRHALVALMSARLIPYLSFGEWQRIDSVEVTRGSVRGAPRSKIASVSEMLEAAGK